MHKIVISGYYGFNNIGDESILKAVVENLRDHIDDIDITVLSQNPEATSNKFNVKAVERMKISRIIKCIAGAELLISGGGSLLQDVTSKRSIIYYLAIMWIALILQKKVFIYSQGIGPVNSAFNRRIMIFTLKRVNHIVVRDEGSKEFLVEYGIQPYKIIVTADPVIRIKKPSLEQGEKILMGTTFDFESDTPKIGIAIKGKIKDGDFLSEICFGIREIIERYNARIVLIPFHFSEDMPITEEIKRRVGGNVTCIGRKCMTEEMLSIIGNMDLLIGVRLHSLIHAAIMDVPMIGISYDPKVNSFMKSLGLRAMCSVYDFKGEYLLEEYEKVMANKTSILEKIKKHKENLIEKLNYNERLIKRLLGEECQMNKRIRILGVPVDMVNYEEAMNRFKEFIEKDGVSLIVTPNSEIVVNAGKNPELMNAIYQAEMVIPDGIGLVYASKILKHPLEERVTGIDFLGKTLKYLAETGKTVFLFGSKPGIAEEAAKRMEAAYPGLKVVGTRNGYFKPEEEENIIQEINDASPDLLCVALGSPKQELFVLRYKDRLKVKAAIGVGGSLDVWSGDLKRAPEFYRKHGLEWLYRFIQEPSRYKRMAVLPLFMLKVVFSNKNQTECL